MGHEQKYSIDQLFATEDRFSKILDEEKIENGYFSYPVGRYTSCVTIGGSRARMDALARYALEQQVCLPSTWLRAELITYIQFSVMTGFVFRAVRDTKM